MSEKSILEKDETSGNMMVSSFGAGKWSLGIHDAQLYRVPSFGDASCNIAGYRQHLQDPVLLGARTILDLLSEFGVSVIRIAESSWPEYWHLSALEHDSLCKLAVSGQGQTLVDRPPTSDRQRWVRDRKAINSALNISRYEQTGWIGLRTESEEFAKAVIETAHMQGLKVSFQGPSKIGCILKSNDIFCGAVNLIRERLDESPLDLLIAWSGNRKDVARERALELSRNGVLITSELVSTHRRVFIKDALSTPFIEENIPIFPHLTNILQMRSAIGYATGKSSLKAYTGLSEPSKQNSNSAKEGWNSLIHSTAELCQEDGPILIGSAAPQLTSVPGFALREEVSLFLKCGITLPILLGLVGWQHFRSLGFPIESGEWLTTSISPQDPEHFIMSLRPETRESHLKT